MADVNSCCTGEVCIRGLTGCSVSSVPNEEAIVSRLSSVLRGGALGAWELAGSSIIPLAYRREGRRERWLGLVMSRLRTEAPRGWMGFANRSADPGMMRLDGAQELSGGGAMVRVEKD